MERIIHLIANKIVTWSAENPSENEREELVYGYTLLLENIYKLLFLLLIACFTGTWFESVIILGGFCSLRYYSGGMHSHSSIGCTLCMVGVWLMGILVSKVIIPLPILIIMAGIIVWTILKYAPKSTDVNPITDEAIKKQKQKGSRIVMTVLLLLAFICGVFERTGIMNMILTSMFIEVFSILLLVEKEEKAMKKMEMKKNVVNFGKQIARESVGKSIPYMFYEPKVPASLKEQISKEYK